MLFRSGTQYNLRYCNCDGSQHGYSHCHELRDRDFHIYHADNYNKSPECACYMLTYIRAQCGGLVQIYLISYPYNTTQATGHSDFP